MIQWLRAARRTVQPHDITPRGGWIKQAMGAISGNELDRQGTAVLKRYEIRIVGELDAEAADAFAGFDLAWDGRVTTLSSELDQAGLHGLLERIRNLGLELLDVRQIRGRR